MLSTKYMRTSSILSRGWSPLIVKHGIWASYNMLMKIFKVVFPVFVAEVLLQNIDRFLCKYSLETAAKTAMMYVGSERNITA